MDKKTEILNSDTTPTGQAPARPSSTDANISISTALTPLNLTFYQRQDTITETISLGSKIMNSSNRNLLSHNISSFNVTNNYSTIGDDESRILPWIPPLESWKRHSDVVRTRAKGVGEWVLQSGGYRAWR
ncbi:hypothetical protein HOY80DRAFT_1002830 [Tuber brumale]|nr:hypothetical protein HOY80DRAFT_1002830 [Tuber brumale]